MLSRTLVPNKGPAVLVEHHARDLLRGILLHVRYGVAIDIERQRNG